MSKGEVEHTHGWFVDEYQQLQSIYSDNPVECDGKSLHLTVDRDLWSIQVPFMMDQQAAKLAGRPETNALVVSAGDKCDDDPVVAKLLDVRPVLYASGFLDATLPSADDYRHNNATARARALAVCAECRHPDPPFVTANERDRVACVTLAGQRFLLPPRCRVVCDDITRSLANPTHVVHQLTRGGRDRFDCVVLDPPWSNRFVRRKRRSVAGYAFLDVWQLQKLPVRELSPPGALVAVWCTNKPAHLSAVQRQLFVSWNVRILVIWHWLKVTRRGCPVTAHCGNDKRPYERLVIGRRFASSSDRTEARVSRSEMPTSFSIQPAVESASLDGPDCASHSLNGSQMFVVREPVCSTSDAIDSNKDSSSIRDVPKCCDANTSTASECCEDAVDGDRDSHLVCLDPQPDRVIISVPCAVHSRKPLLHRLLAPFLPADYRGLEVFARGLLPNWTAWGDQPLLLQRLGALLVNRCDDGNR